MTGESLVVAGQPLARYYKMRFNENKVLNKVKISINHKKIFSKKQ